MDAITLMKENISKTWVNTDMGSGWVFKLYSPLMDDIVMKKIYLDIFDGEDFEYEDWKDGLEEWGISDFINKCEVQYLHHFEEFLQLKEY